MMFMMKMMMMSAKAITIHFYLKCAVADGECMQVGEKWHKYFPVGHASHTLVEIRICTI